MRIHHIVAGVTVAASLVSLPARADVLTLLKYKASGTESLDGNAPTPAVSQFRIYDIESGGDRQSGASASDAENWKWESAAAWADSTTSASANGMNLKTLAGLEGAAASTLKIVPREIESLCTTVNGQRTCAIEWVPEGAVWHDYSFQAYAEAMVFETVSIVSPSATPSSFRLVFDIDGTNTQYLNWFSNGPVQGGTGGGYEVPKFLYDTHFSLNYGEWGHDTYDTLYLYNSDLGSDDFNPTIDELVAPVARSVTSPSLKVGAHGSWPINLWLASRVGIDLTNLDDGRVLFLMESDYSNTVTLRGFEVYDGNGQLLPDAVVTGASGARYTTLGTQPPPVPEPASLALLGVGLLAVRARLRRGRQS